MNRRRYKLIALVTIILLSSLVVIFAARGWIRKSLIPNYFASSAKSSMSDSYQSSYESSLSFINNLGADDINAGEEADCSLFTAENISTEVSCYIGSGGSFNPSAEYKELFRDNSNKIEEELLLNGWTKTWNKDQPIEELFNDTENRYSIGVNYIRSDPKECKLSLFYNAWEEPDNFVYSLSCIEYITYL